MDDKVKKAIEAAEKRFDSLRDQKTEIETELVKIQGEYRALQGLLDEALTIKAEAKDGRTKPKN